MARSAMILDDDRDTLEVLQMALQMEGFHVDTADHPDSALKKILSGDHCVLFVDFYIPSMGLGDFIAKVRDGQPNLPLVLMSGHADIAQKARDFQINRILPKPFQVSQLLSLLREHCP